MMRHRSFPITLHRRKIAVNLMVLGLLMMVSSLQLIVSYPLISLRRKNSEVFLTTKKKPYEINERQNVMYVLNNNIHNQQQQPFFARTKGQVSHLKLSFNPYESGKPKQTAPPIFDESTNNLIDPSELVSEKYQYQTIYRILFPSIIQSIIAYVTFIPIADLIYNHIVSQPLAAETLELILTDNSNQFIQNIHNLACLTFAFLSGPTYLFLYKQRETLYYSLFDEVTLAKSLVEQIALMSRGRDDMYEMLLDCVRRYVREDLRAVVCDCDGNNNIVVSSSDSYYTDLPAKLISRKPMDDPMETILYVTSVGEPGEMYGTTVRELRKARAKRLGALQVKMPEINMQLLYALAGICLCTFPVVSAGSRTVGGVALLHVQQIQMGGVVFAFGCVLNFLNELRRVPTEIGGGSYNVDDVLETMVKGLEEELDARLKEKTVSYTD
mmetsp:Transcript_14382/g.16548  ORF Transcript_14382/g.16548 Transcript_14382/m.16548 type:complete len:440 (-) Transcript_14382:351-1670(-)